MPPARVCSPLLLLLVISPPIGGHTAPHASLAQSKPAANQHTMGRHLKAKGVPNFGQVTPTLYTDSHN